MTKERQKKNNVRSVLALCLATLAVFCLLCTCAQPTESEEGDATVTITIGGGSRVILDNIDPAQLDHTITMTNGSGSNVEKTGVKTGQTVQFVVKPGHWNISVKAYFGGRLVAEGTASVNLRRGRNHSVPITMRQVSGKQPDLFLITMLDDGFGTATANPNPAATGETVIIYADPINGYMFKAWEVTDCGVTLSVPDESPANFIMPSNPVTITAKFESVPLGTPNLYIVDEVVFGDVIIWYAQPAAKTVTIQNSSNDTAATVSSITLEGDNANSFTLIGNKLISTVAADGSATFTIQPNAGLGVGHYTAKIVVTYWGGTVTSENPETAKMDVVFNVYTNIFDVYDDETWGAAITTIKNGGNNQTYTINVTGDFETTIVVSGTNYTFGEVTGLTVNIQGNKTITLGSSVPTTGSYLLRINANQTVNLKEVWLKGHSTHTAVLVYVPGGTFNMESGKIGDNGGNGVNVSGGTFTMSGGEISGNKGTYGVQIQGSPSINAIFTMTGGEIKNNTGTGGGVTVNGFDVQSVGVGNATFTMTGGEIKNNTGGVGVNVSATYTSIGTFKMSGTANIENNKGGVAVSGTGTAIFEMSGGTISGNNKNPDNKTFAASLRAYSGGGVLVNSGVSGIATFEMKGGTIEKNHAASGGGVAVFGGTFTMSGTSKIKDNTAYGGEFDTTGTINSGGGVLVYGNTATFNMRGGEISGNAIKDTGTGGGVGMGPNNFGGGGTVRIENGTIYGRNETDASLRNTAKGSDNSNYYLDTFNSNGTSEYGTFDSSGGWHSNGTLGSTNYTIKVVNGVSYSITNEYEYNTDITTVTIPSYIISINPDAFDGCTSLTSINVDAGNTVYSSQDGVLYNKDKTTLIRYPAGKAGTSFTIPSSVTKIENRAFYYCTNLTSIVISNSVNSIGSDAFSGCINLTSVTFAGTIPSSGFNSNAFQTYYFGDLRDKFYATDSANGTPGTYTRPTTGTGGTWTKQ